MYSKYTGALIFQNVWAGTKELDSEELEACFGMRFFFIFNLVFDFVELLFIFCFVLNSFVAYVYDGILGVRRCLDFV